ncbi:single-stranded-DNA-specific exonuclease RecJ [Entomomonas asaccharolytica]|uniref:Single-stranded-DNA-specific exonuclease RecJ n=1 Tax=Entomomonas asaccharolytica TaxID=2785331 RepID=A0A974ND66_9GAMM|nr:single-stranded-DNA-specific exonuclease RecJ [Entomomonas asaccharolytica]QQP84338.1 single-stranded-DNA-specific exonuclease RecJ [Entomomonas asaccharolytica]
MLIKQRLLLENVDELPHLPPLLKRIYAARGIQNSQQLTKELANLLPYQTLKGIDQAVELLITVLNEQQAIVIVGDYDSDGATATAVAVLGLKMLGAKQVDYLVPNRFKYGYGLSPEIVELAIEQFKPQLLITVDNGISSIEGVAAAKQAGLKVLITDHHLPSETLPAADAMVNPNQPTCNFPSKVIAGVGVIFYVLIALRAKLREINYFTSHNLPEPNLAELLDLVALGTVADVVALDSNNRTLVYQGLKRIQKGKVRPGIRALLQLAGKDYTKITATDLGFIVGPRLNAAGRLDNMKLGIDCLLADDEADAYQKASQLDTLNRERRSIEQSMQTEALHTLKDITLDNLPYGICLFNEQWHEGVIGILASRLKDKYHRPTIIFAATEQEGMVKGSARSITNFHIRDALQNITSRYPDLIDKFGGHAMAAGLTLAKDKIKVFQEAFNQEVQQQVTEDQLQQVILTDGSLNPEDFCIEQAQLLMDAGPWGQGFPEPLFDGVFWIEQQRLLKEKHLKLVLRTADKQQQLEAIAFNIDKNIWPNSTIKQANIVYKLMVNEYKGQQSVQLLVSHLLPI